MKARHFAANDGTVTNLETRETTMTTNHKSPLPTGASAGNWAKLRNQYELAVAAVSERHELTHTPGITVARMLFLTLAACCSVAHFTVLAQAEDPPPRQICVRLDSEVLVPTIERPIEEVQAVD